MRKTRKAAAVLTAVAMAAVSAAPVMADEIKDLYDYEVQTREIETWNILQWVDQNGNEKGEVTAQDF